MEMEWTGLQTLRTSAWRYRCRAWTPPIVRSWSRSSSAPKSFTLARLFAGQVFDSERPLEVGQQVQGGDATFALDSNQVWAGIRLRGRLVSEVRAQPPVVTPNGDGINDAVGVEYSLLELVETGQVAVDIFDLAGRLVRSLYRGHQRSGRHVHLWDGPQR